MCLCVNVLSKAMLGGGILLVNTCRPVLVDTVSDAALKAPRQPAHNASIKLPHILRPSMPHATGDGCSFKADH